MSHKILATHKNQKGQVYRLVESKKLFSKVKYYVDYFDGEDLRSPPKATFDDQESASIHFDKLITVDKITKSAEEFESDIIYDFNSTLKGTRYELIYAIISKLYIVDLSFYEFHGDVTINYLTRQQTFDLIPELQNKSLNPLQERVEGIKIYETDLGWYFEIKFKGGSARGYGDMDLLDAETREKHRIIFYHSLRFDKGLIT